MQEQLPRMRAGFAVVCPHPGYSRRGAENRLRPFGGEKVHWTFCCFRLTSRREREKSGTHYLAVGSVI